MVLRTLNLVLTLAIIGLVIFVGYQAVQLFQDAGGIGPTSSNSERTPPPLGLGSWLAPLVDCSTSGRTWGTDSTRSTEEAEKVEEKCVVLLS